MLIAPKQVDCQPSCWLIIGFLCLGGLGALLARWLGFSIVELSLWDAVGLLLLMPLVETLILNAWLQSQAQAYWISRGIGKELAQSRSIVLAGILFMLAHVGLVQGWAVIWWLIPGLLLAYFWSRYPSVFWLAVVHASWNAWLWWLSE